MRKRTHVPVVREYENPFVVVKSQLWGKLKISCHYAVDRYTGSSSALACVNERQ